MSERKSGAGVPRRRSESKSGAHLRHRGYEQDVASDSSGLFSDDSGESAAEEVAAGGADEVTAGGGLPAGGLGVVMRLAEEAGVIGPPVAEGRPCRIGQNAKGMVKCVLPLDDGDNVLQGVQERDSYDQLLDMAFDERSRDHDAWNRAGFRWYDYDREGRLLGVEDTHSQRRGWEERHRLQLPLSWRTVTQEDYWDCVIRVWDWVVVRDPHSQDFGRVGYVNAFGMVGDVWPELHGTYHPRDTEGDTLFNATHALVWFRGDIWASPVEIGWLEVARGDEGDPTPLDMRWTSLLGLSRTQGNAVAVICSDAEENDPREAGYPDRLMDGWTYRWGWGVVDPGLVLAPGYRLAR